MIVDGVKYLFSRLVFHRALGVVDLTVATTLTVVVCWVVYESVNVDDVFAVIEAVPVIPIAVVESWSST